MPLCLEGSTIHALPRPSKDHFPDCFGQFSLVMAKTYILDTNVLLHDPTALFKFEENIVVLPIFVLEEIDKFKMEMTERGRSARQVSRSLDELRSLGTLSKGVPLPTQGTLLVHVPPDGKRERTVDQDILLVVQHLTDSLEGQVIFVTMDVNLRVRGDALGFSVETYENQSVDLDTIYSSVIDVPLSEEAINSFYKVGWVEDPEGTDFDPNASILLEGPHNSAGLGRYLDGRIHKLKYDGKGQGPSGIKAKNKEQAFALDLLMDPKISLVTIVGQAGTGKTLLALAAGLHQLETQYDKLLISRPVMPMGKDLGYLPGTIDEKLDPWMKPLFDNLEYLCMASKRKSNEVDDYFENGIIQVEPLTYIRGRSLPGQFIIVDEAQNLSPHEVKTIITRAGEGTKIILTGDPHQIDNPYVDATSNGLSVTANLLKRQHISGHITLTKGERSELANIAAELL